MKTIPPANPGAAFAAQKQEILETLSDVLESGQYILGPSVARFETQFASYLGSGFCVGVASGTDALFLALKALGIQAGDEVVTAANTVVATVAAIEMAGAKPVLADVEQERLTLDPASLADALFQDRERRIKCVLPVHLYGQPADMDGILALTRPLGLPVVEDCAQAHGARWRDAACGTLGDLAAFSFYPTKILGALGDGGAVTGSGKPVEARLRQLRQYGWDEGRRSQIPGFNSRLDEIQAAILTVKLKRLAQANLARRHLAEFYDQGFAGLPLGLPARREGSDRVYTQYTVRCRERDALAGWLAQSGIGVFLVPPPVSLQPAYLDRLKSAPGGLPVTMAAAKESLSLPFYPELGLEDAGRVVEAVQAFYLKARPQKI
jgi:dTDP-4-amino-4,6-dideoxygalactose transaminase